MFAEFDRNHKSCNRCGCDMRPEEGALCYACKGELLEETQEAKDEYIAYLNELAEEAIETEEYRSYIISTNKAIGR